MATLPSERLCLSRQRRFRRGRGPRDAQQPQGLLVPVPEATVHPRPFLPALARSVVEDNETGIARLSGPLTGADDLLGPLDAMRRDGDKTSRTCGCRKPHPALQPATMYWKSHQILPKYKVLHPVAPNVGRHADVSARSLIIGSIGFSDLTGLESQASVYGIERRGSVGRCVSS